MDESTWSFAFVVTVLTSFFSGADSFTHPAAVVTWTDAGHAVGDYRSVSAVCRVEMKVLPNGEQELPPDSVTVFFTAGHNQGNISFDTGSYTDRDCTQSRTVTSTYGYAMKSLDQGAVTVESADLYARLSKSKCVIDHGRTPNREIVIVVDPFTHLEATAWVCLASWHGRGTLSANLPRPKFAPVWNGDGMPQIVVSPFEDGRPRELGCTLDGYNREVAFAAEETKLVGHENRRIPYRPAQFILSEVKKDGLHYSELGSVWGDLHGRLNSSTSDAHESEIPARVCTNSNMPIYTCFSDAPRTDVAVQNQLTSKSICNGYDAMGSKSLLASMARYSTPRVSLAGDHPFEIDSLLVNFDKQCSYGCTPTTAPLIDIRFKSPHLLMQLPRVVKPVRLTNTGLPDFRYWNKTHITTGVVNELVITPELMAQFYRYHIKMVAKYKRYRVFLMPDSIFDRKGFVRTTISCGSNVGAYLVLASGSCKVMGSWVRSGTRCGTDDPNKYQWHNVENRGSNIGIVKRKYFGNPYLSQKLTCAWRAYICYSEPRSETHEKLHGITLVEQEPGEPYVVTRNATRLDSNYMLPGECPKGDEPIVLWTADSINLSMADIPREIKRELNRTIALDEIRLSTNVPIHVVNTKCPCREQVSFCNSRRPSTGLVTMSPPNIDLAVMASQPQSRIHCEVFERRSKLVGFEELGEQAACTNTYRGLSAESERTLLGLMPKPKVVVNRVFDEWGRNLYRISCSGNRKTCIDRTTIQGADPDSELGIRFHGMSAMEFHAPINTDRPMKVLLEGGTYMGLPKWAPGFDDEYYLLIEATDPLGVSKETPRETELYLWDARNQTNPVDYSMSVVVDYEKVLKNYSDIQCMYKNGRVVSEKVNIKDVIREADVRCHKNEYVVEMYRTSGNGVDHLVEMQCSVNYSSASDRCGQPNVVISAVNDKGQSLHNVMCLAASPNPSDWRTIAAGVVDRRPGHGCLYFDDRVVSAISTRMLENVARLKCEVVDEVNDVNFMKEVEVSDLDVGCSVPPPDFLPAVQAEFNPETKMTVVNCSYPEWVSDETCVQEGTPVTDVELVILYRSQMRPAASKNIAIRYASDGNCASHPAYACTTGKLPSKLLVSAEIPGQAFVDLMREPAPDIQVRCSMGSRYTDMLLKETMMYLTPQYVSTEPPKVNVEDVPPVNDKKKNITLIALVSVIVTAGVITICLIAKWLRHTTRGGSLPHVTYQIPEMISLE